MKKILKIAAILLALGIIGIQFSRPERVNPPIVESETLEANLVVPGDVAVILERSCKDCHSNKVNFPWYSNIAPVSWQVVDHIRIGREKLNFSIWGTYSAKRQHHKLEEICEEVESGEMPHNQYLWIHWDAVVSPGQVNILCEWTKRERSKFTSLEEKSS